MVMKVQLVDSDGLRARRPSRWIGRVLQCASATVLE